MAEPFVYKSALDLDIYFSKYNIGLDRSTSDSRKRVSSAFLPLRFLFNAFCILGYIVTFCVLFQRVYKTEQQKKQPFDSP